MWINIEIKTDFILECGFKFLPQVVNKLGYPVVVFVVFLAVAYKDIVFVSRD